MKSNILNALAAAGSLALLASCSCNSTESYTPNLQTRADSASYAIGVQQGAQLINGIKSMELQHELDMNIIVGGFINALNEQPMPIDPRESMRIVQEYVQKKSEELQVRDAAKKSEEFADVKAEGEKFLAENTKRPEVTTTESGLQYEILKKGKGDKPTATDRVKVHYTGTLIDGTVFDSSVERGEPAVFPVNRVIAGWTEALQLMPVGSKWKLYIPQELAYGSSNASGAIKPYSMLIFEVELLGIEK